MSIKLCPKCHVVRNLVMSISTRVTSGPRGKLKQIRTKLFHCETCKSLVCSEDIEPLDEAGRSNGSASMFSTNVPVDKTRVEQLIEEVVRS